VIFHHHHGTPDPVEASSTAKSLPAVLSPCETVEVMNGQTTTFLLVVTT
jgi:hypothetical protein